jgi:hypothetical protein
MNPFISQNVTLKKLEVVDCPHCAFLHNIFTDSIAEMTNREYWLFTEMFVYLHHGRDHCTKINLNK